jgi:hypothetical protein
VFSLLPGWAKKILGIASPSKVFMGIGKETMKGFAVGVKEGGEEVTDNMDDVTEKVVDSGKAMFGAVRGGGMGKWVKAQPVITPVLDLTNVKREAGKVDGLLTPTPITAGSSWRQATAISAEDRARQDQRLAEESRLGSTINFEQNNYSPKALSDVEIYRRTKNQLSQTKLMVGVPAGPDDKRNW